MNQHPTETHLPDAALWHAYAEGRSDERAELDEAQRDDLAAARPVVSAIKAISLIEFTPEVAAQIAAVLSAHIGACSWSHFEEAASAIEFLDDAHDLLTEGV